jgi:hypothetical protein
MPERKVPPENDGKSQPSQEVHLDRRRDQARRAKAVEAAKSRNAGPAGNIRQNTRNQGYQQDR